MTERKSVPVGVMNYTKTQKPDGVISMLGGYFTEIDRLIWA